MVLAVDGLGRLDRRILRQAVEFIAPLDGPKC